MLLCDNLYQLFLLVLFYINAKRPLNVCCFLYLCVRNHPEILQRFSFLCFEASVLVLQIFLGYIC